MKGKKGRGKVLGKRGEKGKKKMVQMQEEAAENINLDGYVPVLSSLGAEVKLKERRGGEVRALKPRGDSTWNSNCFSSTWAWSAFRAAVSAFVAMLTCKSSPVIST